MKKHSVEPELLLVVEELSGDNRVQMGFFKFIAINLAPQVEDRQQVEVLIYRRRLGT